MEQLVPYAAPIHRHDGYRTPEQFRKQTDKARGTTAQRGYDAQWHKLRRAFLAEHPYCECDTCKGQDGRELSQVVDHIHPIEDRPELRLVWDNLRAMSKRHHDAHTARTRGYGRGRGRTL
jgi:5-methylcytosine-specific restriction enzyme A